MSQIGSALAEERGPLVELLRAGSPAVADAVDAALAELQPERRPSPQGLRARHHAAALYLAAAQRAALSPTDPRHRLVAGALDAQIEAAAAALRAPPARGGPSARSMEGLVRAAVEAIGDVELPPMGTPPSPELLASPPSVERRAEPEARPRPAPPPRRVVPPPRPQDAVSRLESWMIGWIAREMGMTPQAWMRSVGFEPSGQTPFSSLGIDSVMSIQFVAALEEKLGRAIPANTLWDHGNMRALATFLVGAAGGA
ncbi:MAG: acyl carrier protein [bacterium]